MLEEVRGHGIGQAVHHAGSIAAPAAGTLKSERTGGVGSDRSAHEAPSPAPGLRSRARRQAPHTPLLVRLTITAVPYEACKMTHGHHPLCY
ncbi:hypothetical protein F750_4518 [Streptomyces sp. PAMC 26508]|nr:hypothetical protein F750_4518 [Streptomyces sp. PAMC 26508]